MKLKKIIILKLNYRIYVNWDNSYFFFSTLNSVYKIS